MSEKSETKEYKHKMNNNDLGEARKFRRIGSKIESKTSWKEREVWVCDQSRLNS